MKVIQPYCRERFTGTDVDFICSVLASNDDKTALQELLHDPAARDRILDEESLFQAVLEKADCVGISHHFYFYMLVRHVLRETGIDDRDIADYVAEVLAEFSHLQRVREPMGVEHGPMDYMVDMKAALQEANEEERFVLRAHMGNLSLFLSGVFPAHLHHRAERRGAPNLSYYEGVGSASYREASNHRLAKKYKLGETFAFLSDAFRVTRIALNDMADRLVSLGEPDPDPVRIIG